MLLQIQMIHPIYSIFERFIAYFLRFIGFHVNCRSFCLSFLAALLLTVILFISSFFSILISSALSRIIVSSLLIPKNQILQVMVFSASLPEKYLFFHQCQFQAIFFQSDYPSFYSHNFHIYSLLNLFSLDFYLFFIIFASVFQLL